MLTLRQRAIAAHETEKAIQSQRDQDAADAFAKEAIQYLKHLLGEETAISLYKLWPGATWVVAGENTEIMLEVSRDAHGGKSVYLLYQCSNCKRLYQGYTQIFDLASLGRELEWRDNPEDGPLYCGGCKPRGQEYVEPIERIADALEVLCARVEK